MGMASIILGSIVLFAGNIMVVIAAFRASMVWGLGSLLIPLETSPSPGAVEG